jgi:hypothetical protein
MFVARSPQDRAETEESERRVVPESRDGICEADGMVELPLLLSSPWFHDLLAHADATGVTLGRLLRRLIVDYLVESGSRVGPTTDREPVIPAVDRTARTR